jgi:hypothetical protein
LPRRRADHLAATAGGAQLEHASDKLPAAAHAARWSSRLACASWAAPSSFMVTGLCVTLCDRIYQVGHFAIPRGWRRERNWPSGPKSSCGAWRFERTAGSYRRMERDLDHVPTAERLPSRSTAGMLDICKTFRSTANLIRNAWISAARLTQKRLHVGADAGTGHGSNLIHLAATLHARWVSRHCAAHKEIIKLMHLSQIKAADI